MHYLHANLCITIRQHNEYAPPIFIYFRLRRWIRTWHVIQAKKKIIQLQHQKDTWVWSIIHLHRVKSVWGRLVRAFSRIWDVTLVWKYAGLNWYLQHVFRRQKKEATFIMLFRMRWINAIC